MQASSEKKGVERESFRKTPGKKRGGSRIWLSGLKIYKIVSKENSPQKTPSRGSGKKNRGGPAEGRSPAGIELDIAVAYENRFVSY